MKKLIILIFVFLISINSVLAVERFGNSIVSNFTTLVNVSTGNTTGYIDMTGALCRGTGKGGCFFQSPITMLVEDFEDGTFPGWDATTNMGQNTTDALWGAASFQSTGSPSGRYKPGRSGSNCAPGIVLCQNCYYSFWLKTKRKDSAGIWDSQNGQTQGYNTDGDATHYVLGNAGFIYNFTLKNDSWVNFLNYIGTGGNTLNTYTYSSAFNGTGGHVMENNYYVSQTQFYCFKMFSTGTGFQLDKMAMFNTSSINATSKSL